MPGARPHCAPVPALHHTAWKCLDGPCKSAQQACTVDSDIYSFMHASIRAFMNSSIHSFIHSFIHWSPSLVSDFR